MGNNANQPSPPMASGIATITATTAIGVPITSASGVGIQDVDYVCVQVSTGLTGTLSFEQSNDGITWFATPLYNLAIAANPSNTSLANPGNTLMGGPVMGKFFRVRCSVFTSGSCTVQIMAYEGQLFGTISIGAIAGNLGPNAGDLPAGATFKQNASGNVANASANCTIAAPGAGITTWITGFEVTGLGATAAGVVLVTLGILGGTLTWVLAIPAGVTLEINRLIVEFSKPIPATGPNVAVTLTVPAFGAGNTNAAAVLHGYAV